MKKQIVTASKITAAIFPIFGATSLFWWSYTLKFPNEIIMLITPRSIAHILAGFLIVTAVSMFFSRIIYLIFYYLITWIWDLVRTYPFSKNGKRMKRASFFLSSIRRFFRKFRLHVELCVGAFIFLNLSFSYFPFKMFVNFIIFSIIIGIMLRITLFRVSKELTSPYKVPAGVSAKRVQLFYTSWITTSALYLSLLTGHESHSQKLIHSAYFHIENKIERLSIIMDAGQYLIVADVSEVDANRYIALPTSIISRIQECD